MKLTTLIAAGLTATLLGSGFSYAQTAPAQTQAQVRIMNEAVAQMPEVLALIEELKAQGYTDIEIRRTLLGRARITAQGPAGTREVVMSTATGEVMRDMSHGADHGMGDNAQEHNQNGEGNHGGGMDGSNHEGGNMDGSNHEGGNMGGGSNGGGMSGGMGGGSNGGGMSGGMGGN